MNGQIETSAPASTELLGDAHPLLAQLGPADGAVSCNLSAALQFQRVRDLPSLRRFLQAYQTDILRPLELPAIQRACEHARRHEVRELLALDAQLIHEPLLREFAVASCRVGQRQLSRLRPLRDLRAVQRYLQAIENGEARGWHTLVYGLSLAVYSLPLRQGLLNYAHRTLGGFIENAAGPLRLAEGDCQELHAQAFTPVPDVIDSLLTPGGSLQLRIA